MPDAELNLGAIEAYARSVLPEGGERRLLAERILDVIRALREAEDPGTSLRAERIRNDADATLRDLLIKIGYPGPA